MPTYDIANRLVEWQERVTSAPRVIDTDHGYIHAGIAFQCVLSGVESASTDKYVFVTPSTKYVHWRPADIDIEAGSLIISLFEDTTAASTGPTGWTPVTNIYNHNRISSNTATVTVYSAATSTGGTQIDSVPVFGGSGPGQTKQGASDGKNNEWVLARGTQYRVHIDTTQAYYTRLFWYEEGDG